MSSGPKEPHNPPVSSHSYQYQAVADTTTIGTTPSVTGSESLCLSPTPSTSCSTFSQVHDSGRHQDGISQLDMELILAKIDSLAVSVATIDSLASKVKELDSKVEELEAQVAVLQAARAAPPPVVSDSLSATLSSPPPVSMYLTATLSSDFKFPFEEHIILSIESLPIYDDDSPMCRGVYSAWFDQMTSRYPFMETFLTVDPCCFDTTKLMESNRTITTMAECNHLIYSFYYHFWYELKTKFVEQDDEFILPIFQKFLDTDFTFDYNTINDFVAVFEILARLHRIRGPSKSIKQLIAIQQKQRAKLITNLQRRFFLFLTTQHRYISCYHHAKMRDEHVRFVAYVASVFQKHMADPELRAFYDKYYEALMNRSCYKKGFNAFSTDDDFIRDYYKV